MSIWNRFIWIAICIFCTLSVRANDKQHLIDSLKTIIQVKADTNAAMAYYELGKVYTTISLDSSVKYFLKGQASAVDLNFTKGKIYNWRGLGSVLGRQGRYEEALSFLDKGMQLIQNENLPVVNRVDFLINTGAAHYFAGNIGKAIESYIEAVRLCRENGFDKKRALLLNNLGIFYRNLERHEDAIGIYEEALELRTNMKDTMGVANILFNSAAAYGKMKAYEKALENQEKAIELYRAIGSEDDLRHARLSLGTILKDTEKYREALEVLQPIAENPNRNLRPSSDILLHLTLAEIYLHFDQANRAKDMLDRIEPQLSESSFLKEKVHHASLLIEIHDRKNNVAGANQARKRYISLLQEKSDAESKELKKEMETKYLSIEKDHEIDMLNAKNEIAEIQLKSAKQRNIGFAIGFGILAILSFFLFRIYQKIKVQHTMISKANEEKAILLKEIHHRVKNNLQVVSSLLGLQSRYVGDDTALDAIKTGRSRVQSMSILHQNLYRNENLKSIRVKKYFGELGHNLFSTYHLGDKEVEFETDIDDLELDIDIVVPMGLIVNELISNALKHAFPDKKKGTIRLIIKQAGDNIRMCVQDNGVGIQQTELPDRSASLGLQLIKSFSEKLDADVHITNDSGTSIELIFNPENLVQAA